MKQNAPDIHPSVELYAKHFGIEPEQFLRFLKGREKIPGLLVRFKALRRLESNPIPIKDLISTAKKA
jgi:hypothetical protein